MTAPVLVVVVRDALAIRALATQPFWTEFSQYDRLRASLPDCRDHCAPGLPRNLGKALRFREQDHFRIHENRVPRREEPRLSDNVSIVAVMAQVGVEVAERSATLGRASQYVIAGRQQ